MLSFHRANPAFGQHIEASAPTSSGYGQRQQGERDTAAVAPVAPVAGEAALPHCLHFLQGSVLLKRANLEEAVDVEELGPLRATGPGQLV